MNSMEPQSKILLRAIRWNSLCATVRMFVKLFNVTAVFFVKINFP